MTGGQLLVMWCAVAGLVVVVLAEYWRRHEGPPMGTSSRARLLTELHRYDDERAR